MKRALRNRTFLLTVGLICGLIYHSFAQEKIALVPLPVELKEGKGQFVLNTDTQIGGDTTFADDVLFFVEALAPATGFDLKQGDAKENSIFVQYDADLNSAYGKEAYRLKVDLDRINIQVGGKAGAFYAFQTLLQLLPTEIFSRAKIEGKEWKIPVLTISDYPRFGWRGFMLDASRSFQPVSYVKKTLDLMALHKMNVFHWHLTDDHGWRIEIKKHPVLTEKGAWRPQPNYPEFGQEEMYGGYYTQEEIRDIIKYAAERNITIIPEVDVPGHSAALVYAFPELACSSAVYDDRIHIFDDFPKRQKPFTADNKGTNVICPCNEYTFEIVEDILAEVMDLFPSEYIHIGGDEVDKKWWKASEECAKLMKEEGIEDYDQLQAYFIKRLEGIVNAHGKKLIGWDEILEGGLSKTATVMGWRGMKGTLKSIKEGRDAIIAANTGYYIQKMQTESPFHPQKWPGMTTAEHMYNYKAIPDDISDEERAHILGIQSSLWTPFMGKPEVWDIAIYPRNCAMSEVAWTPVNQKDWKDYQERLKTHLKRLAYKGVSYWRENEDRVSDFSLKTQEETVLTYDVSSKIKNPGSYFITIDYTDGDENGVQLNEVVLLQNGKQIASDSHLGFTTAKKDHDRIYFLDVQNKNDGGAYTVQIKLKNLGESQVNGVIYVTVP